MSAIHTYLLYGLQAAPVVLEKLTKNTTPEIENHSFDPERFTIREVTAHLADLESVWGERISAILATEGAPFVGREPEAFKNRSDYDATDAAGFLEIFRAGRAKLVETLSNLPPESWEKHGTHSQMGKITIHEMVQFILGHDGYHMQQVAEWVDAK